jgi:hypothetical protein
MNSRDAPRTDHYAANKNEHEKFLLISFLLFFYMNNAKFTFFKKRSYKGNYPLDRDL